MKKLKRNLWEGFKVMSASIVISLILTYAYSVAKDYVVQCIDTEIEYKTNELRNQIYRDLWVLHPTKVHTTFRGGWYVR